jgi:hypothetical protein
MSNLLSTSVVVSMLVSVHRHNHLADVQYKYNTLLHTYTSYMQMVSFLTAGHILLRRKTMSNLLSTSVTVVVSMLVSVHRHKHRANVQYITPYIQQATYKN